MGNLDQNKWNLNTLNKRGIQPMQVKNSYIHIYELANGARIIAPWDNF